MHFQREDTGFLQEATSSVRNKKVAISIKQSEHIIVIGGLF